MSIFSIFDSVNILGKSTGTVLFTSIFGWNRFRSGSDKILSIRPNSDSDPDTEPLATRLGKENILSAVFATGTYGTVRKCADSQIVIRNSGSGSRRPINYRTDPSGPDPKHCLDWNLAPISGPCKFIFSKMVKVAEPYLTLWTISFLIFFCFVKVEFEYISPDINILKIEIRTRPDPSP